MSSRRLARRVPVSATIAAMTIFAACVGGDPKNAAVPDSGRNVAPVTAPSGYHGELSPGFRVATRDSLVRKFGTPDSIGSEVIPNRHVPGVVDTIFTLYYSGLVATVHKPGGGHDMLSAAVISHNRYLRTPVIGVTATDVAKAYGSPDWSSDSSITYNCVGSCIAVEDPVEFIFAGSRVRRVRLSYYVD